MKVIRKILYLILFISLASGYILAQNISDEQIIQLIQQGNKIRMQNKTQSNKDKVEAISISEIRDWHQLLQSDFNEQLFS